MHKLLMLIYNILLQSETERFLSCWTRRLPQFLMISRCEKLYTSDSLKLWTRSVHITPTYIAVELELHDTVITNHEEYYLRDINIK